jgi:hypothetical protein
MQAELDRELPAFTLHLVGLSVGFVSRLLNLDGVDRARVLDPEELDYGILVSSGMRI